MKKLTGTEESALRAVWKTGEGNLKLILDNAQAPRPPYTTFASIVGKLEEKGYVKSRLIGNSYFYRAVLTEAEYADEFLTSFVQSHFANSFKQLVSFFVSRNKLKPKELKEILEMIEKNKKP